MKADEGRPKQEGEKKVLTRFQKQLHNICFILVCTKFTMGWEFVGLMMKRDVSENVNLAYSLINRMTNMRASLIAVMYTVLLKKSQLIIHELLLCNGSKLCDTQRCYSVF